MTGVTRSYHRSLVKTQVGHHFTVSFQTEEANSNLTVNVMWLNYPHLKTETLFVPLQFKTGAHLLMPSAGKTENDFYPN